MAVEVQDVQITSSNTYRLGCCRILSIAMTNADIWQTDAGAMLDNRPTGSHEVGVDMIKPVIVLIAEGWSCWTPCSGVYYDRPI